MAGGRAGQPLRGCGLQSNQKQQPRRLPDECHINLEREEPTGRGLQLPGEASFFASCRLMISRPRHAFCPLFSLLSPSKAVTRAKHPIRRETHAHIPPHSTMATTSGLGTTSGTTTGLGGTTAGIGAGTYGENQRAAPLLGGTCVRRAEGRRRLPRHRPHPPVPPRCTPLAFPSLPFRQGHPDRQERPQHEGQGLAGQERPLLVSGLGKQARPLAAARGCSVRGATASGTAARLQQALNAPLLAAC